ncbi:hypothetical protein [Aureitalea marina]|uniref:Carbonic anhydrase n=1 Tax=Aureitalea marina TaxID=930804 RepID=A0A2S7KT50_9FLAO|nr:hypothetical protein [Aureitalea marina]PQB05713.1 hypothetical protein BST85_12990 [Aureitalea marina]
MPKRLFFICPTDHLETPINEGFQGKNYFVTSLGNSIVLESAVMEEINALIEVEGIREIYFVLSKENRIVQDALNDQKYINTKGIDRFYEGMDMRKELSKNWFEKAPFLFDHLAEKMIELNSKISGWLVDEVEIGAYFFDRDTSSFIDVFPNLISRNSISLN